MANLLIHQMGQLNLWFNVVLFVAMIGPQLRCGVRYALRPHVFGGATQAVIARFIGGQLLNSTANATKDALGWIRADWDSCVFLNGVCLQNGNRSTLLANLRTLSLRDDFTHTVVLSAASTEVRLLGFNRGFPWYEPFDEVIRQSDVDRLANWIGKSRIEHVIVDSSGSAIALASPLRQQHLQNMVAQLKSYRELDGDSAWITLNRIHDH